MRSRIGARRIGALAAQTGLTVDTLRYYEREGLLPSASRSTGGFRLYTAASADRARFIKQARQLGLSLREIRQLVDPDNRRCAAVRAVIVGRLADVDRRMSELAAFRRILRRALHCCDETLDRSKGATCPVVRRLGAESAIPATGGHRRRRPHAHTLRS
jgi:DNA-binding transcriptional MerR regulator